MVSKDPIGEKYPILLVGTDHNGYAFCQTIISKLAKKFYIKYFGANRPTIPYDAGTILYEIKTYYDTKLTVSEIERSYIVVILDSVDGTVASNKKFEALKQLKNSENNYLESNKELGNYRILFLGNRVKDINRALYMIESFVFTSVSKYERYLKQMESLVLQD